MFEIRERSTLGYYSSTDKCSTTFMNVRATWKHVPNVAQGVPSQENLHCLMNISVSLHLNAFNGNDEVSKCAKNSRERRKKTIQKNKHKKSLGSRKHQAARVFVFIHEYLTTMDINAAIKKNTTYHHILIYGCTGP